MDACKWYPRLGILSIRVSMSALGSIEKKHDWVQSRACMNEKSWIERGSPCCSF